MLPQHGRFDTAKFGFPARLEEVRDGGLLGRLDFVIEIEEVFVARIVSEPQKRSAWAKSSTFSSRLSGTASMMRSALLTAGSRSGTRCTRAIASAAALSVTFPFSTPLRRIDSMAAFRSSAVTACWA